MEAVINDIRREVREWSEADTVDGGIADLFTINSDWFGDPGVIAYHLYPAVTVQPLRDEPESETTGYEVRDLHVLVSILIDAREFFNASVEEATGDRDLTRAAESLRLWMRRRSNRSLGVGVRELVVRSTEYMPGKRDEVITKEAHLTLVVNKQYQRQP